MTLTEAQAVAACASLDTPAGLALAALSAEVDRLTARCGVLERAARRSVATFEAIEGILR